ncbi:MAG: diversity-generating retroelement protein Avd [Anaerolineae bacterium]|nr:diversity-generating retroelement protein Avd [Anaerolineae bacterium]
MSAEQDAPLEAERPPFAARESPLFAKTYDLLRWLSGRMTTCPKAHRFRLAKRIEDAAFRFHELLIQAAWEKRDSSRLRLLLEADMELDKVRFYLRLSAEDEVHLLTFAQWEHASRMVAEVGRLLGGWINKESKKKNTGGQTRPKAASTRAAR